MKTVKHPGPLMRLRIANAVAEVKVHGPDAVREHLGAARRGAAIESLSEVDRVYFAALAGALERLLKEMS